MSKKVLIVGGVAGGASAAARLRRLNEDFEIIMFEKGEYISFANCGLPYYIGDSIKNRAFLLVQTVEGMKERFKLDVRNLSEVIEIDRKNKKVKVKNHKTGDIYEETYDELILSPGAMPKIPYIEGIKSADNLFTLRNIADTDRIKNYVDINKSAFEGCWYLFNESIDVELVKGFFQKINAIGDSAFYDCRYGFVNGIYLYSNIKSVGSSAFFNLAYRLNYI